MATNVEGEVLFTHGSGAGTGTGTGTGADNGEGNGGGHNGGMNVTAESGDGSFEQVPPIIGTPPGITEQQRAEFERAQNILFPPFHPSKVTTMDRR